MISTRWPRLLAARGCRVLAVDVAGRGRSGWQVDPTQYAVPVYAAHIGQVSPATGAVRRRLGRDLDGRADRHGAGGRRAPAR